MPVGSHDGTTATKTEGALALASEPRPVLQPEGPRLVPLEQVPVEPATQPVRDVPVEEQRVLETVTVSAGADPEPVRVELPTEAAPASEAPASIGTAAGSDLEALQTAMVSTLAATKGQQSASEQMEESTLAFNNDALEIQTTLSKTMLPVVFNADCERILKNVLRDQGHGALKLKFLPGSVGDLQATAKKTRSAPAGSAKELAAKHPVVQEAQRLFSAEIRNVIDLRKT